MLSVEENRQLTQTGPGTPMGELFRRYWHPIAASGDLEEGPTRAVRVLGEDLVLYKDRSGTLGLLQEACAHRRVNLLYGVPEQVGLRCAYHGWLYDETGQCLETPAEAPDSTFKDRITITAYPVQELGGLVFAYLGPEPAPLLPQWDLLVRENVHRDIGFAVLPCNWMQAMENSLDPVHNEWLHGHFADYVQVRMGHEGAQPSHWSTRRHEKIGFEAFEHGIIKRRILTGGSEDDLIWRVGHPILFPNMLRVGGAFHYRVPMDDTHTFHVWYTTYPELPDEKEMGRETIATYRVPFPGVDERGQPQWSELDYNAGQDSMAWITQGPVADRSQEKLAESDKGIIVYRQMLKEQLAIMADGGEPMNVFRDPAKNVQLTITTDYESQPGYGMGGNSTASKHSPVLNERAARQAAARKASEGRAQ